MSNEEPVAGNVGNEPRAAAPVVSLGRKIFSFATFDAWVDGGQRIWRFHEVKGSDTLCIDQLGRVCGWGKHFMTARDEGAFPVDVYLLRADMDAKPAD